MEDIFELGKGGQSWVLRLVPFSPIETVAKLPLIKRDASGKVDLDYDTVFLDLLVEDGYLKMLSNHEYVCSVLEEVILFNKEK